MFGKVAAAALLGLSPALGQSSDYKQVFTNFAKVRPHALSPSSSSMKQFGKNVGISNGRIAVTSTEQVVDYTSSNQISTRGRVSVFGMDYLRRFTDSGIDFTSSVANDGYGFSLDIFQNNMLVGAPYDNDNAGKVYAYYGDNLQNTQTLTAERSEPGDYFGYSVAISHGINAYGTNLAIVGAYGHDHDKESTVGQGCVFVFAIDSSSVWSQIGMLEPQDFEHKDHGGFGYSLSSYGNTVAVGTYSTDKAYVFELLGHLHECPHGHEEKERDDFPSECVDTDDDGNSNGGRRLRSLQGPPEEEKRWYTEWKYDHIMTVGVEEEHKPEKEKQANSYSFGHTVALYNSSGLLTLAVAGPDAVNENDINSGMVYVMSIMNRGDVQDQWYPEGYDHHEEDKQREEAEREAEREEREAEEQERREQEEADREADKKRLLQGEADKNRFRTWNILKDKYCGDKIGNFWILESTLAGSVANERFGHSMKISSNVLLIGNNPSTYDTGKALYFARGSTSVSSSDSPLVSGPLYNTAWSQQSQLNDKMGMTGDHFGYSLSFEGNIAVVGALMNDIKSDGTFGQGAVYVYDRISLKNVAPTMSPTPASGSSSGSDSNLSTKMTDTHSTAGITFISATVVIGVVLVFYASYSIYRGGGDVFSEPAEKQIRVATMDDSGITPNPGSNRSGQQGLKSAYSGLDTSSSHGTSRMPARPSPYQQKGSGGGSSRTFTPQAQRTFTPKSRSKANDDI